MEAAIPVMLSDEVNKVVVNSSTMRKPKNRPRTELMEHDELLLDHNSTVVTLLSLLDRGKDR